MTEKYQHKYRVDTSRAKWWDYNNAGLYYVTICTNDRINYFGDIVDNEMVLSDIGKMAVEYWLRIPVHLPFVELDEFIVMPDHIHGIIVIENTIPTNQSPPILKNIHMTTISPKYGSLSSVIRSYKSALTKWCNSNNLFFEWQSRFYDRIIRNDDELNRVRQYIRNNLVHWKADDAI
ncbi:MAG: transposase [Bacteroidales bacterium]|nr:transposase [Bacteroidales bacterium]